jgi:hypothetical protein
MFRWFLGTTLALTLILGGIAPVTSNAFGGDGKAGSGEFKGGTKGKHKKGKGKKHGKKHGKKRGGKKKVAVNSF